MGGSTTPAIADSPVLVEVHEAANVIMKAGSVLGAAGAASGQPEVALVGAAFVLAGAGLHGLAYAHELALETIAGHE